MNNTHWILGNHILEESYIYLYIIYIYKIIYIINLLYIYIFIYRQIREEKLVVITHAESAGPGCPAQQIILKEY